MAQSQDPVPNTHLSYSDSIRNDSFHDIFKSVPKTDRLITDFSCALSREILLQGRLYLTQNSICFNSNILGWVTNLIIALNDITSFGKKSTAGLFPNAIVIETVSAKHILASFISRDATLELLSEVWEASRKQPSTPSVGKSIPKISHSSTGTFLIESESESESESEDDIVDGESSSIVSSINPSPYRIKDRNYVYGAASLSSLVTQEDSDAESSYFKDDDKLNDDNELELEVNVDVDTSVEQSEENSPTLDTKNSPPTELKVPKVRSNNEVAPTDTTTLVDGTSSPITITPSKKNPYHYKGPKTHTPTSYNYNYSQNNETILTTANFSIPMGLLFDMLFGHNHSLWNDFIIAHDGEDISLFTDFKSTPENSTESSRTYNFIRRLNYTIGPKQTKCYLTETIKHYDPSSYASILVSTSTPDVPSGNSFTVKTHYILNWGNDGESILTISCFVVWTGGSWIKGIVESKNLETQKQSAEDLIKLINKTINDLNLDKLNGDELKLQGDELEIETDETVIGSDIDIKADEEKVKIENIVKQKQKQEIINQQLIFGIPITNTSSYIIILLLSLILISLLYCSIMISKSYPLQSSSSSQSFFFKDLKTKPFNLHDTIERDKNFFNFNNKDDYEIQQQVFIWDWLNDRSSSELLNIENIQNKIVNGNENETKNLGGYKILNSNEILLKYNKQEMKEYLYLMDRQLQLLKQRVIDHDD